MNIKKIKCEIKNITKNFSKGKILDLCTGNGDFIDFIKDELKNFSEIIGVDIHNRNIEKENFIYRKMDIYNLNFPQNYFDIITISNSLHHIENLEIIFSSVKKYLKEDGFFIINEMFSDNQSSPQQTHVLLHHFSAEINKLENIYHRETYKKDEIKNIIKTNNFIIENKFEFYFKESIAGNQISELIDNLLKKVPQEKKEEFTTKSKYIIENYLFYGFQNATQLLLITKPNKSI
ncbi:MAG: class I SAM-dependent methyltransferase [Candidatus Sericytochromatia bacterium]